MEQKELLNGGYEQNQISQDIQESLRSASQDMAFTEIGGAFGIEKLEGNDKKWAFVERYKRDQEIGKALNNLYYWKDDGGFTGWYWGFYDEWDTVFAHDVRDSRVLSYDDGKITAIKRQYYDIEKHWDYYVWITLNNNAKSRTLSEQEAMKEYDLLDKKGVTIKRLRWRLYQREDGLYVETYRKDRGEVCAYYDNQMNLLVDEVNRDFWLLEHENGEFLFTDYYDNFFVRSPGTSWDRKRKRENELEDVSVYKKYKDRIEQQKMAAKETREKQENLPLKYTIEAPEKWFMEAIKTQDGKEVFVAEEGYKYSINHPQVSTRTIEGKMKFNEWIFILNKFDANGKHLGYILINANNGFAIEEEGNNHWIFVFDKIIGHYTDWGGGEAILYTLLGEKLWVEVSRLDNNHDYKMFQTENGKKQLIEQKTGIIHDQQFDTYLKRYKENGKVVVIVQDWDEIKEIRLS